MHKRLKILFNCDTYKELATILGVRPDLLYLWNTKSKAPDYAIGLLKLIESQQKEILKLREQADEI